MIRAQWHLSLSHQTYLANFLSKRVKCKSFGKRWTNRLTSMFYNVPIYFCVRMNQLDRLGMLDLIWQSFQKLSQKLVYSFSLVIWVLFLFVEIRKKIASIQNYLIYFAKTRFVDLQKIRFNFLISCEIFLTRCLTQTLMCKHKGPIF